MLLQEGDTGIHPPGVSNQQRFIPSASGGREESKREIEKQRRRGGKGKSLLPGEERRDQELAKAPEGRKQP